MRGATNGSGSKAEEYEFLLTRPMRGATRTGPGTGYRQKISTHTPHAGRD